MAFYTIVIRHSMYGDTVLTGEILDEAKAKTIFHGAELVFDLLNPNPHHERLVLVTHEEN